MLILASNSPRRKELLKQIGVSFEAISISIDESRRKGELPFDYVERMAREKVNHAFIQYSSQYDAPFLSADTSVCVDDFVLGKPKDYDDFRRMMRLLSDRSHEVLTSIALKTKTSEIVNVNRSAVTFSSLNDEFIEGYWAMGEPKDKAGGYAIQGVMARFIKEIQGSYSGIMGLPLYELSEALTEINYTYS